MFGFEYRLQNTVLYQIFGIYRYQLINSLKYSNIIIMSEYLQANQQQIQGQISSLSFKEDFLCGSLSGVANCLTGYIFDTLKVKVQMDPSRSMMGYIKMMYSQGRILHLYDGIYYPLITVPIVNSVVFGAYEFYKKITGKKQLSFIDGIENGAFAGLVNCIVVTPVQLIKCRMQLQNAQFTTSQQCFKAIWQKEGIFGLYRGNSATIYRQIPAYGAQFATYQIIKSSLTNEEHKNLTFAESLFVGGMAGTACWLASYPQDIVKTKLQVQPEKYRKNRLLFDGGFFDCARDIYKIHGWRGFFHGLQPCLVRAVVANSFGFAAYQKTQQFIQSSKFFD